MSLRKQKQLTFKDVNTLEFKISTGIVVSVHVVGFIAWALIGNLAVSHWTTYNLLLMFLLLIWNEYKIGKRFVTALLLAFSVGLFFEVVGVNTGILFGRFSFSDVLGFKIFEVPLIIGLNWFKITYCAYVASMIFSQYIAKKTEGVIKIVFQKPIVFALLASFITTFFDILMEPIAIKMGFWNWENNTVPFFNYVCWFFITFLLTRLYQSIRLPHTNGLTIVILVVQSLFFLLSKFILP